MVKKIKISGRLSHVLNNKLYIAYDEKSGETLRKHIDSDQIFGVKCPFDNQFVAVSYDPKYWEKDVAESSGKLLSIVAGVKKYKFISKFEKNSGEELSGYNLQLDEIL